MPHRPSTATIYCFFVLIIVLGALMGVRPARGQDCEYGAFGCGHHERHEDYKNWKNNEGGSCCNGQDCRPVRARFEDGIWQFWVPELKIWVDVPRSAKQHPDKFKDGRSHACTSNPGNLYLPSLVVYCFSPAEPKI